MQTKPNHARVWRGWAIAEGTLMVLDHFRTPFVYPTKREALLDTEEGQGAIRVTVSAVHRKGRR